MVKPDGLKLTVGPDVFDKSTDQALWKDPPFIVAEYVVKAELALIINEVYVIAFVVIVPDTELGFNVKENGTAAIVSVVGTDKVLDVTTCVIGSGSVSTTNATLLLNVPILGPL